MTERERKSEDRETDQSVSEADQPKPERKPFVGRAGIGEGRGKPTGARDGA